MVERCGLVQVVGIETQIENQPDRLGPPRVRGLDDHRLRSAREKIGRALQHGAGAGLIARQAERCESLDIVQFGGRCAGFLQQACDVEITQLHGVAPGRFPLEHLAGSRSVGQQEPHPILVAMAGGLRELAPQAA